MINRKIRKNEPVYFNYPSAICGPFHMSISRSSVINTAEPDIARVVPGEVLLTDEERAWIVSHPTIC